MGTKASSYLLVSGCNSYIPVLRAACQWIPHGSYQKHMWRELQHTVSCKAFCSLSFHLQALGRFSVVSLHLQGCFNRYLFPLWDIPAYLHSSCHIISYALFLLKQVSYNCVVIHMWTVQWKRHKSSDLATGCPFSLPINLLIFLILFAKVYVSINHFAFRFILKCSQVVCRGRCFQTYRQFLL